MPTKRSSVILTVEQIVMMSDCLMDLIDEGYNIFPSAAVIIETEGKSLSFSVLLQKDSSHETA